MSAQPANFGEPDFLPAPSSGAGLTPPHDLSPEEQEQRVARWTRILSGEEEPEYLVPTPEITEIVRAQEERFYQLHRKHITAGARQRMLDDLTKQYYFGGHIVVVMETPRGEVVLAFGEEECSLLYRVLYQRLPDSLRRKVASEFIEPW